MSPTKGVTLSQAIEGMLFYKRASNKSPRTTETYNHLLSKLKTFFRPNDPPLAEITKDQLVRFFVWLKDEYVVDSSRSIAPRPPQKLSSKTVFDIYGTVSALWGWAAKEELIERNIVRDIEAPKVDEKVIEPLLKEQVEKLLEACNHTGVWKNRETTVSERPTADRDRAIILALLDTGLRAQELCDIQMKDIDLKGNSIKITGKGSKERVVYFGKRTARAIWKYLLPRIETYEPKDYLFVVDAERDPRKMDRRVLLHLLERIGDRAGIAKVHPHKFRHSFAITYLRNNGDAFTLQTILGHSSLEMVRKYLRIAQQDCARVHQTASPVDNWKL